MIVEEKVKSIIAFILGIEESEINLSDNLVDTLGFDSIDIVEFMTRLEGEFNIEILDSVYYSLITVKEVIDYVEKNNEAV